MTKRHRPSQSILSKLRRWLLIEIPLLIAVVLAIQAWQGRSLVDQDLPATMQRQSLPSMQEAPQALLANRPMTLIYAFAPWCQVCELSAANINDLATDDLAVHALALSWSSEQAIADFLKSANLHTTVLIGRERDAEQLGISVFPSYLLVSREGQILTSWTGYTTRLGIQARLAWYRWSL